jgi:hypothetical protein
MEKYLIYILLLKSQVKFKSMQQFHFIIHIHLYFLGYFLLNNLRFNDNSQLLLLLIAIKVNP